MVYLAYSGYFLEDDEFVEVDLRLAPSPEQIPACLEVLSVR